jgi:hypothetical protein
MLWSDAIIVSVHPVITHPAIDAFDGIQSAGSAFAALRGPV